MEPAAQVPCRPAPQDWTPAALWAAIESFEIDEPEDVALRFAARLARENGWSRGYAERVIAEYKRFLFLAVVADHAVTPSDQVDQVWHLHLTYTRSYWQRLCGEVLGQPLHHGPTQGGAAERSKYEDWYMRTKASYEAVFGAPPPADVWPASRTRFGRDLAFRRVNLARHWLLPKWPLALIGSAVALVAPALLLSGCTEQFEVLEEMGLSRDDVWLYLFIFVFVALVLASKAGGRRGGGGCGGGCGGD